MIPVFSTAIFGLILNKNSYKLPISSLQNSGNKSSGFGTPQYQAYSTGFIEALSRFWGNYFNFSGRATRSEFWFAILLNVLANIAFFYFSFVLLAVSENRFGEASEAAIALIVALQIGWTAITLIPYFSLYTRRLHDTNRSGWLLWLNILVLPAIYLIGIMGFCKSYQGTNKFGDSEKYPEIPQEEQD